MSTLRRPFRAPAFALSLTPLLLAQACLPCSNTSELCLVAESLPEAHLSVRALADDDVWLVGSEALETEDGPSAVAWDGSEWTHLDTSDWSGAELWWVHPTQDRVTMVGTQGLILEYDRATETLEEIEGPDDSVTFFGVWGASADDVWAVGGTPGGGDPPAIWRRDADGWTEFVDPALGEGGPGQLYFKVHGSAADDVFIVGNFGIALHWDGSSLSATPTDADLDTSTAPLLTVNVGPEEVVAVGGAGSALILHYDRSTGEWRDRTPEFQAPLNGVCSGAGEIKAVGMQGSVQTWDGQAWQPSVETLTFGDYHGCEVTEGGDVWAVGGQIAARPITDGVVAFQGEGGVAALD